MTETEGDKMKLYKVLGRVNGKLFSPFQGHEYEPGREYICVDFDPNPAEDCSRGYYATDIDGIIYSFRNLPGYEVWEVEVGGKGVEIDQFKRRYERITLLRQIPPDELKMLAEAEEENVGYKLAEALFPVNPLKIKAGPVTDEEIDLLKKWDSVCDSVWGGVLDSVRDSIRDSSVWGSIRGSVLGSVRGSVWAYISSLYTGIKNWKYFDHPEGENPFQPCIDLWHRGFVPSFDGKIWRLHAGENAEVVWEGEI